MGVLLIIIFLLKFSAAFANETLFLIVGQQRSLPGLGSATLTNPKTLLLKKENNKFLMVGKKSGYSNLKLKNTIIDIYVLNSSLADMANELEKIFKNNSALNGSLNGKRFVVSGKIDSHVEWIHLSQLSLRFKKNLSLDLRAEKQVLTKVQELVANELAEKSIHGVKVDNNHRSLKLIYSSQSSTSINLIREIGEKWGLKIELAKFVELRPMIEIEITIAEVKRNLLRSLGFVLPGQYTSAIVPFKFNAQLNEQTAKIIASPKLICRSGETANFIAGGEIPIKLVSSKIADVQWKKYGVILNISPTADGENRISSKLITEVSLLDEAHTVDGIPGILTNRIETHFNVTGDKTIALSGLIKNELGRGENGPALLGEIPIIGDLFKSHDYKQSKTELLVLVTPRVITPDENKKLPQFWKKDFWKNDQESD